MELHFPLLLDGATYEQIVKAVEISTATISRINRCIQYGSGGYRDTIEKVWGLGYANSKRLQFNESGVTGLAHYIAKDKHFFKRWNQSRNLTIPQCAQFDGQLNMDDIADIEEAIECGTQWQWFEDRYPDFQLVEATCYKNNINRGTYIHFEMRRREWSGSSAAQPARMKKRTPSGRP